MSLTRRPDAFSLIIPYYNNRTRCTVLLNELLRQKTEFPQTEIIVVDDGSDGAFLDGFTGINVIHHEKNMGVTYARNTGINAATGEYIAFLDCDDYVVSDYLRIIYTEMRKGYAWVSYDWRFENGEPSRQYTPGYRNNAIWAYTYRYDTIGEQRLNTAVIDGTDDIDFVKRVIRPELPHYDSTKVIYIYFWHGNNSSLMHRSLRGEIPKTLEEKRAVRKLRNAFFLHCISPIGGVETFLYQMALKYGKTHDIAVIYKQGDPKQVERLSELVRCIKWDGKRKYKADRLFFGYSTEFCAYCEAQEYYMVFHCDYKAQQLPMPAGEPYGTHFIGVSESVVAGCKEWLNVDADVVYNPLTVRKPKKVLRLISATRLTREKGRDRMEALADKLEKAGIPFTWEVFTDSGMNFKNKNFVRREIRLDILDYVADADYLVQLSDTEGYSYSIIEALAVGTPVIVTDLPCNPDMQVKDGVNAFVLKKDMSNVDAEAIYKGLKKFKYTPRDDGYAELLATGESTYEEDMKKPCRVRVRAFYFDLELQRNMKPGEEMTVTQARADKLFDLNLVEYVENASSV